MIKEMFLRNFKCFEEMYIEMDALNVFAGINSMGKSTAIQALLLLRQSYEMNALDKGIYLNGCLTSIGTGYDLLYRNSQTDEIYIELNIQDTKLSNVYCYSKESDFQKLKIGDFINTQVKKENLFGDNFSYVSAEREGPKRYYNSSYHEIYEENQVGVKGEYYAAYISERGMTDVVKNDKICHPKENNRFIIYQLEAWMSELSPGLHINTKKIQEAGIVSLDYTVASESYIPINVGFGLSYVAPIVLSLLKANKGDLVILENPEAHLHPKGQRIMGELIARAASGGVQIIVETHSDHLLNGIRLSVKKGDIKNNNVRLNYFYCSKVDDLKLGGIYKHEKCSPMIMNDGSLSDWPDGFFDEWDKALEELF